MTDQTRARRVGQVDARYMTHPTRTHSSGDPCPAGPFPHPAESACLDPTRSYVISTETLEDQAAREALPAGATLEPWTDADTDELAAEMAAAAHRRRDRWMLAQRGARRYRVDRGAAFRLTTDELATAAARSGLVADGECLPLNALHEPARRLIERNYAHDVTSHNNARLAEAIARQRELGDVADVAARHYRHRATYTAWTLGDDADLRALSADVLRGDALPFAEHQQAGPAAFDPSWPIALIAEHAGRHDHDPRRNGCCDELDAQLDAR